MKCKYIDCYYRTGQRDDGKRSTCMCNYLLYTGEKRNSPAEKCNKYISKEKMCLKDNLVNNNRLFTFVSR